MSCEQQLPVTWYLTLPTNSRTVAVSPFTSLSQIKNIYGIEVARGTANECSQGGYLVEQLFVKAQQQLNLMPVQCSTVCFGNDCSCDTTQVYFSKLSVLYISGMHCSDAVEHVHSCIAHVSLHVHVHKRRDYTCFMHRPAPSTIVDACTLNNAFDSFTRVNSQGQALTTAQSLSTLAPPSPLLLRRTKVNKWHLCMHLITGVYIIYLQCSISGTCMRV